MFNKNKETEEQPEQKEMTTTGPTEVAPYEQGNWGAGDSLSNSKQFANSQLRHKLKLTCAQSDAFKTRTAKLQDLFNPATTQNYGKEAQFMMIDINKSIEIHKCDMEGKKLNNGWLGTFSLRDEVATTEIARFNKFSRVQYDSFLKADGTYLIPKGIIEGFDKDGKEIIFIRKEVINTVLVSVSDIEQEIPVALHCAFGGASWEAGDKLKKLAMALAHRNLPSANLVFTLKSKEEQNQQGQDFYSFVVDSAAPAGRQATPEEMAVCYNVWQEYIKTVDFTAVDEEANS